MAIIQLTQAMTPQQERETQNSNNNFLNADKISATQKGAANGVATLDANSVVPLTQLGFTSGSNTNGNYIKYPDGTMICTKIYNYHADINNAEGSLYYGARVSMGDWAVPFITVPAISATATSTGNGSSAFLDTVKNASITSAGTINAYKAQSTLSAIFDVHILAIGKWK